MESTGPTYQDPARVLSHENWTGKHWKIVVKLRAIIPADIWTMSTQQIILNFLCGNMSR